MDIAKEIANYLDKHSGIYMFNMSFTDELLFDFLLEDILKHNIKPFIREYNNFDFQNSIFCIELNTFLQKNSASFDRNSHNKQFRELFSFCLNNGNSVIIKDFFYQTELTRTQRFYKYNFELISLSDFHASIYKNVMKIDKNRYANDFPDFNLTAYMRDKKINDILND